ncbi:YbiU family protein [Klebsiella pneumoniae]
MAALPTHETLPADHKAAIRQMKQALRAQIGDVQAVFDKLSARISERLQEIETLKAGDSVWWHCDIIHSVAPVENQQGWGNVMYIPAAPMCEKNLAYAQKVKIALEKGASPGDFPREDYEASWQGRFTLEDLNIHGKRALGMPV